MLYDVLVSAVLGGVPLGAPKYRPPTERVIAAFSRAIGFFPESGLVEGPDGALYGTTYNGPISNLRCLGGCGTVYRVTIQGQLTVLHQFSFKDGAAPIANLLLAPNGRLYGTTTAGPGQAGGTIFWITPDGSQFRTIHRFEPNKRLDGSDPEASLIEGTDGFLYGTTFGGTNGGTTIFRILPDGRAFQVLHASSGPPDTYNSAGPLLEGSDDRLYGAACEGGPYGYGAVFVLNRDGSGYQFLHAFDGSVDGACPGNGLLEITPGVLVSTTTGGSTGSYFYGTVYQISIDGTGFRTIAVFNYTNGAAPLGDMTRASDGRLYGATLGGGAYRYGVVFRVDLGTGSGSSILTVVHSFIGAPSDGERPIGPIVQSHIDHKFYGVTDEGGPNVCGGQNTYCGVVYRLSP